MMREVPLEGAIHIDAFRNMNWSWEPDGFIGPIEELECGVKPIVQWLKDRGIDVTTESCDHSRTTVVSSGSISTRSASATGPASSFRTTRISVTPVARSPQATAVWMGEAPRYLGRIDACRLSVPSCGAAIQSSRRIWP